MTEERRTHVPPERIARRIPVRPGLHHILTLGVEVRMLLHVLDDSVTKRDVIILRRSDGEGEELRVEMQGLAEVRPGYVEAIFNGVIPGLAYDCTIEPGGDAEKVYPVFVKTILANDEGAFEILMPPEEEEAEEAAEGAEEADAPEEEEDSDQPADLVTGDAGPERSEEEREFLGSGVIGEDLYEGVAAQEDQAEQEGLEGQGGSPWGG